MTLAMKKQGWKIITHEEFLARCCDHPDELFNYIANTFNCIINLESKYHKQVTALGSERNNQGQVDEELIQTLHIELQ